MNKIGERIKNRRLELGQPLGVTPQQMLHVFPHFEENGNKPATRLVFGGIKLWQGQKKSLKTQISASHKNR